MLLHFRSVWGQTLLLEVEMSDTMLDVRDRLCAQTGVPVSAAMLVHYGRVVDYERTLGDYDVCKTDAPVFIVRKIDGRSWVSVELPDGRTARTHVSLTDSVDAVTAALCAVYGVAGPAQLSLLVRPQNNALRLNGALTLEESSVHDWATLRLDAKPGVVGETFPVFVRTLTGRTATFTVHGTDTLSTLREQLHASEGVAPAMQRLILRGRELDQADDATTLAALGVGKEENLHMLAGQPHVDEGAPGAGALPGSVP